MQHKILNNKDIYIIIAKNLKRRRKQLRMTQKELAEMTGYSYAYIRRIEGPNCSKHFSVLTLYNICIALDVDISSIFEDKDI